MDIIIIAAILITTWVKESITLVVADYPVFVVDSLIQEEVMTMVGSMRAAGRKKIMAFILSPEFSSNNNLCWKSAKDHSTGSESLSRNARDCLQVSSFRRDSIYKCYSREKSYFSRERSSKPSKVCYVCGRQDHYKKVCPEKECHKCYKKGHISRECPLRELGSSSGHSSDRMRHHERRTEDRDRSPLNSRF